MARVGFTPPSINSLFYLLQNSLRCWHAYSVLILRTILWSSLVGLGFELGGTCFTRGDRRWWRLDALVVVGFLVQAAVKSCNYSSGFAAENSWLTINYCCTSPDWYSCRHAPSCSRYSQLVPHIEKEQRAEWGLWIASRQPSTKGLFIERRKGSFAAIGAVDERTLNYQRWGEDERPFADMGSERS